jgi:NACalpha-BTF3-like transcription factor
MNFNPSAMDETRKKLQAMSLAQLEAVKWYMIREEDALIDVSGPEVFGQLIDLVVEAMLAKVGK